MYRSTGIIRQENYLGPVADDIFYPFSLHPLVCGYKD